MRNFSDIPIDKGSVGIDPTPEGAKRFLRGTIKQLLSTFDRSIERWGLSRQEGRTLNAIVGRSKSDRNLLASNLVLRRQLGFHLIDLLHEMESGHPDRRFFLVTLLSDRWLSFDRYSQLWLGGMKDGIHQVMRLGGFAGWFGLIELQTLDETVRFFGRLLLPHAHFIAWTDDPDFDAEQAEKAMAASGRLESRTSASTVFVKERYTSVCNMAAYVMKGAALAKRRVPSTSSPGGFALDECALPPVSAVRQLEVLSQATFDELMLSGGDGKLLRSALVRHMHRVPPRNAEIDTEQAARFWARLRTRRRRRNYKPVRIHRSKAQLPTRPPISLALGRAPREAWTISWLMMSGQATGLTFSDYLEQLTKPDR